MARPDILILGDHAYSWQALCELRKQQLAARQAAPPRQLALFDLKDDRRLASVCTAAGRYSEPSLFDGIEELALRPFYLPGAATIFPRKR
jgi:hypothetical protein